MAVNVWYGIIIGGAGGAIAGLTVYVVQHAHQIVVDRRDARRIHRWLRENSPIEEGRRYRSTRAIASYNNLTEDRVRFLCSQSREIHLSTGEKEDLWSIHPRDAQHRT